MTLMQFTEIFGKIRITAGRVSRESIKIPLVFNVSGRRWGGEGRLGKKKVSDEMCMPAVSMETLPFAHI